MIYISCAVDVNFGTEVRFVNFGILTYITLCYLELAESHPQQMKVSKVCKCFDDPTRMVSAYER